MTFSQAVQQQLVQSLCRPGVLEPGSGATIAETHISYVLLTRSLAYKIKKSVDLGFVDFTRLEDRARYCREELRLNRRTAPELYLGITRITGDVERPVPGGDGVAIEYAVRMKRFPREMELGEVVDRGEAGASCFEEFALDLARFHASIPPAPPQSPFAGFEALDRRTGDNFAALEEAIHDHRLRHRVAVLKRWNAGSLARHRDIFAERKQCGRVRECHGDLHLGNLVMIKNRIVAFDCLEFSPTLRWIDVASELAFLLMDLYHRRCDGFARRTLNRYLEASGDYEIVVVLRHYLVYRAMVRAKVASLRDRQLGRPADEDRETLAYLSLAERFVRHRQPRQLIITHGLSGCGKTWLSRELLQYADLVHLRSDILRRHLPEPGQTGSGLMVAEQDTYSRQARENVYVELEATAGRMLHAGYPALVDATFLDHGLRQRFRRLAAEHGVPYRILHLDAPEPILRARIQCRQQEGSDASEAGLAVLAQQIEHLEPLRKDELPFVVAVDAGETFNEESALTVATELGLLQGDSNGCPR